MSDEADPDELYAAIVESALQFRNAYGMQDMPLVMRVPDVHWEVFVAHDIPERALRELNLHIRPKSFDEQEW